MTILRKSRSCEHVIDYISIGAIYSKINATELEVAPLNTTALIKAPTIDSSLACLTLKFLPAQAPERKSSIAAHPPE